MNSQLCINRVSHKLYRYTRDKLYLTEQQRDFYETNGFLVVRNLIDRSILDECKQRFVDMCEKRVDLESVVIMKDASLKNNKNVAEEYKVNKIQNLLYDETFLKYVEFAPLLNIVQSIVGPNITAFHSMVINKPPDSDKDASRHPVHQDLHYFPMRPAESIVAAWTAMERVDDRNGCLFVIPGSHKGQLYQHEYPPNVKNMAFHGVLRFENAPKVNLAMEKGDTVFFHPLLLHGSGSNFTKGFRKAICCHYADTNSRFIDVRGTTQAGVAEELMGMAQKHGYPEMDIDFTQYWKFQSKLVRGPAGSFQNFDSHL